MSELENLLSLWELEDLIDVLKANGINSLKDLDELLKDCNFRDFVQLIPTITHRLKLRKKYNDYNLRFNKISYLQNSPSTSSTPSTPIVFDIIEDNCTIIDAQLLNEDQNKDLIEIENNNQPKIEN